MDSKKDFQNSNGTILKIFQDKSGNILVISIYSDNGTIASVTQNSDEVEKEIAGVHGTYSKEGKLFTYISADKKPLISISASDDNIIEECLKLNKD